MLYVHIYEHTPIHICIRDTVTYNIVAINNTIRY